MTGWVVERVPFQKNIRTCTQHEQYIGGERTSRVDQVCWDIGRKLNSKCFTSLGISSMASPSGVQANLLYS